MEETEAQRGQVTGWGWGWGHRASVQGSEPELGHRGSDCIAQAPNHIFVLIYLLNVVPKPICSEDEKDNIICIMSSVREGTSSFSLPCHLCQK